MQRLLHPSLTIADLYKKHESFPPNARIAHAMYQVKYIEALETGLTDLLRRCREAGLKKPLLEELSGRFRIVLWRKKITNKAEIKSLNDAKIIAALTENGNLTLADLADKLQIKYSALRARIEVLKKRGLRHEGSRKAGKWEWSGREG